MTDRSKTTLILVVVLGIGVCTVLLCVGIGGILLVPAVHQAREAARRDQVRNNLAQLNQALEAYHQQHPTSVPASPRQTSLANALATIQSCRFVDLTHPFEPGIPHWPGFPDEERETIYGYEEGDGSMGSGFFAQRYSLVGQWGTHCDPPAHFAQGKRTIDQIDVKEMILPLVVLDVHGKAAENPDYTITVDDVQGWEERHGPIPEGAFVAMRTDWSKRWPDADAMRNEDEDGVAHCPGWSLEVLQCLYEQRKVTASGHETLDTDPGVATSKGDYSLETYLLSTDHYQIELLTNLDQVPEVGAVVVVAFPKAKGGSGFPARVFAVVP
jgi:kynurenine formamidase